MRWDMGLTGPHLAVAGTPDSPLRVVAGPGTGKTFALMRRVGRLLEAEKRDPKRVLVCTFTRTAATDLAHEIRALGVPGSDDIWAGTLHAFCFSLLSRSAVLQATGRVPRPLHEFESRFMLEDLRRQGFGTISECQEALHAFEAAWARLQADDPGWPHEEADKAFQYALMAWMRFHRCMLIGELVPEAVHYLRDNPESSDRQAFDHVLVDEYQDLNRAEQVILDLLAGDGGLTIVGDEDQSIYGHFRYAHPEGIAQFSATHPGTHDENLSECRRCPRIVVDMANSLITHNSIRSGRTLACHGACPEGEVAVVQWRDMKQEAAGIALAVNERVKRGDVEAGRVLILAPRRQLGYAVRDALKDLGTPAHSFFNEEVFDGRPQDRDACASQQSFTLLNLLADPEDAVSLRCWCGFGSNSLESPAWARLREHCAMTCAEPRAALARLVTGEIQLPHSKGLVSRFADLQARLADLAKLRGQDLVDTLFPEGESWAEAFRGAPPQDGNGEPISPMKLLDDLRARVIRPELPTDVGYVRVMSLHKSKGLTADMVVVLGCIRGMIPAIIPAEFTPAEQQRFVEEQRRLFFVALTRSGSILVLSNFANVPRDLGYQMRVPVRGGDPNEARTYASPFLGELGHSRPATLTGNSFLLSMGIEP